MQVIVKKFAQKYKAVRQFIREPRHHLSKLIQLPFVKANKTTLSVLSSDETADIDFSKTLPPSRFANKPVKYYETATGNYFLPDDAPNDVIIHYMKTDQIFEPEIVAVAQKYIKPGSTVLDIGANLGQMAVLFSKMAGPAGRVLTFEADDFIFSLLQKNLQANNCENVRAFYGAVFDKSRDTVFYPEQTFTRFSAYGSYGIDLNAEEGRKLQTLTIDDLDIQSPISFMKVDIQGSDLFALKGAVKTIAKHQMPILFEYEEQFQNEFNTSFQDYMDFISSISYKVLEVINGINYLIVPDHDKFESPTTIADNQLPQSVDYSLRLSNTHFLNHVCKLLKSKNEVEECTHFLHRNGFISHNLQCKDWDIAHIVAAVGDGNFLDMGSSDSYILKNLSLKRTQGEKYGIDFKEPDVPISDVKYIIGDLMKTGLPTSYFKHISCLSVLEHEVDYDKFAAEASRLLEPGGRLYVTFDYWDPKLTSPIKLYNLAWQPLDQQKVREFISTCQKHDLHLTQDFDFTSGDPVIEWGYYSPHPTMAYTFGMAVFEKQK